MRRARRISWLSALSIGCAVGLLMAATAVADGLLGSPFTASGDRIVAVFARHIATERDRELTSFALFGDWRAQTTSVERLSGYTLSTAHLHGEPAPLTVRTAAVTADFFEALEARPAVGRALVSSASTVSAIPECVISDALWRRRFGASMAALGTIVYLDPIGGMRTPGSFTIVGVAPPTLRFPERVDVWLPFSPPEYLRTNRSGQWFGVVGRLRPGVSVEQATTEMTAVMTATQTAHPGVQPTHIANLIPIRELLTARYRALVIGLAATAGVLLLVVAASTGGLLAAGALREQQHDRIRLSLGAAPARLIAAAGRDGVVTGIAAFVVAVPAALASLRLLDSFSAELFERPLSVRIGWSNAVAGVACAVLVSTALAVLVKVHALAQTRRAGPWPTRQGVGGGRATTRLRSLLIVGEIALSVLLLAAAGELLARVAAVRAVDLGFQTERLLTVRLALPATRYAGAREPQFYASLIERLSALPSVATVAASSDDPLFGVSANPEFTLQYENRTLSPDERIPVLVNGVTDAYFDVLGLRVVEGSVPSAATMGTGVLPAAINQTFARRLFPDGSPIGRRFRFGGLNQPWWTIVGLVADARNDGPLASPKPTAYLRYPAFGKADMTVLVKTRGEVAAVIPDIRAIVADLDSDLPIARIASATDLVEARFANLRIGALVTVVLAAAALFLSGLGLYGVLTAIFTQGRPEIGLRIALGATPGDMMRLVLGRTATMAAAGLFLGAICTAAVGLMLRTIVRVDMPAPTSILALIATVASVALMAAAWPAWQATRVSPGEALRAE